MKTEWEAQRTGNLFVELNSLLHTQSQTFTYFVMRQDGIYICCLPTDKLWEAYHAKDQTNRGDGSYYERDRYKHVGGGDQKEDNPGILLPSSVALQIGQPYNIWKQQFIRQLV